MSFKAIKSCIIAVLLTAVSLVQIEACPVACTPSSECEVVNYTLHNSERSNVILNVDINLVASLNQGFQFVDSLNREIIGLYDEERIEGRQRCQDSQSGGPCYSQLTLRDFTREDTLVSWNYTCNYSQTRIPQILWEAQCNDISSANQVNFVCKPIHYRVPVIELTDSPTNCNPLSQVERGFGRWRWRQQEVAVACSCVRPEEEEEGGDGP